MAPVSDSTPRDLEMERRTAQRRLRERRSGDRRRTGEAEPAPTQSGAQPGAQSVAQPSEISPDDLFLVQKRQEWRLRFSRMVLRFCESCEVADLVGQTQALAVESLKAQLARVADRLHQDLPMLLVASIAVQDLQTARHRLTDFIDQVIQHVRRSLKQRLSVDNPLESAAVEDIEAELQRALRASPEATVLFLEDLLRLESFESEVRCQRKRIRLLLGGDRRLAALGGNEEVVYAELEEFWRLAAVFQQVFGYLRAELPPLVDQRSSYLELERELRLASQQFRELSDSKVAELERQLEYRRRLDQALVELVEALRRVSMNYRELRAGKLGFLLQFPTGADDREISRLEMQGIGKALRTCARELERLLHTYVAPVEELTQELPSVEGGSSAELTERLRQAVPKLVRGRLLTGAAALERAEASSRCGAGLAALQSELRELDGEVAEFQDLCSASVRLLHELRAEIAKPLRQDLCACVGELRTFLQTAFAHIAAKDPRSTESSYHFFLREFSVEAQQAVTLLKEMEALGEFMERLQQSQVAGLPLTPENLARILKVLFDEQSKVRRIPSGEGWLAVSHFLEVLSGRLVPRLHKLYSMEGVRFEDKDVLSRSAADLACHGSRCIAQHDMGYSLVQEIGRLREMGSGLPQHETYQQLIVAKTCREMQASLRAVCTTFSSLIPYLGIMQEGVERRASVFFHRQHEVLGR